MNLNPRHLPVSNQLNATQRKSIGAGIYTGPRKKEPNEALPRTRPYAGKYDGSELTAPPARGEAAMVAYRIKSLGGSAA